LPVVGQPWSTVVIILPRGYWLARLIEVFSGMDRCGIFTKETFSIPLGMPDTGYNSYEEQKQPHGTLPSLLMEGKLY